MSAAGSRTADRDRRPAGHGALRFRPDIEGMRAVAIALVLCDHLGLPGFEGGFIGVDVFFVISGFLITSLLAIEHDRNRDAGNGRAISIRGFYGRRARRILPASLFVIAATLVASKIAFNPLRFAEVQVDALWATFFAANIELMLQATDYFAQGNTVSPLQNYWSLAVEEQFYLVWPALLALLLAATAALRRRAGASLRPWRPIAFAVVASVTLASLAWSIAAAADNPAPAYFSPFTRAWELAVGAAIALATPALLGIARGQREAISTVGAALILVGLIVIDPSTPYPGSAALLPVIGSAALIVAGLGAGTMTAVSRGLSIAPMRFLGKISYSLYLWHWPIIVIFGALHPAAVERPEVKAALLVACILVSWVSYLVIEQPFRKLGTARPPVDRRPSPAAAWMGVVAVAAVIPIAIWARPEPSSSRLIADANERLAPLASSSPVAAASEPPAEWRAALRSAVASRTATGDELDLIVGVKSLGAKFECLSITDAATARRCVRPGRGGAAGLDWPASVKRSVVLYGNSHAGHWDGTLLEALPTDVTLHTLTRPGCHVTTRLDDPDLAPDGKTRCGESNRFLLSAADRARPGLVVISAMGSTPAPSVAAVAERFTSRGVKVLWISLAPLTKGFNKCLDGTDLGACQGPLFPQELERADESRTLAQARGVEYFDLVPFLCVDGHCPSMLRGVPIRSDGNHISQPMLDLLRPYLARKIELALARD